MTARKYFPTSATANEIRAAVDSGAKVFWKNEGYEVIKDSLDQYLIRYTPYGHCFGLTHVDDITLNGKPEDFFVLSEPEVKEYFVTWEIQIDAESPRAAAAAAHKIQQDPFSTATVFNVVGPEGNPTIIDLEEDSE